ncbi:MAG TPA: class I SAM-dependent methyltransferase [Usitatibacter sp.]|nr:class I SAM-dependent methyltransferase [Usitatibacter sp.]
MGIALLTANAIINAHKNQPIGGKVLLCGRQSVFLTPEEVAAHIRSHGLEPQLAVEDCELDRETRIGGEGQSPRDGTFISDRSFFRMLGVETLEFLDHSDYEGAQTIVDLNEPVPPTLESKYDFIIDGGTLDNVFNPAQALMNLSRMLKPGGRLLTYNYYANFRATYTNLPHQWYLDYFAINRFAFAQTYFLVFDGGRGRVSVYQANLAKRASTRDTVLNFPAIEPTIGIGLVAYAVKAPDSTWARQPSQECYRSDAEWREMEPIFTRFAAYPLATPIQKSTGTMPILLPGRDSFQYVDVDGVALTQDSRDAHERRLRRNILAAMKCMAAEMAGNPWGIFELEGIFFELLKESPEARSIVARENVFLFDARMLNPHVNIDGVRKRIHPGTAALVANMPILVICTEPQVDVLWRRVSRLFRHLRLYSACLSQSEDSEREEPASGEAAPSRSKLVDYFSGSVYLSPSLEAGQYKGYSVPYPLSSD